MNKTMITEHFSLEEMTRSNTLKSYNSKRDTGRRNLPDDKSLENLKSLCIHLEMLRKYLGKALIINSGYRSDFVNKLVGGAEHSLHKQGLAADIYLPIDEMADVAAFAMNLPKAKEVLMSVSKAGRPWLHFGISTAETDTCRVGIDYNGNIRYTLHYKKH